MQSIVPLKDDHLDGAEQLSLFQIDSDAALFRKIFELPKIDLHRHLTGSITAEVAIKIAAKYDIALPAYVRADLEKFLFSDGPVANHKEYFQPWPILNKLFASLDAVYDVVLSAIRDAAEENVVYLELRLGPRGFLGDGEYGFDEFMRTVTRACKFSSENFGCIARCVLGVPRHVFVRIPSPIRNRMFARMIAQVEASDGIFVGVDLNGDELAAPASEFQTFFDMASEAHLSATVHAGELGDAEDVDYAVSRLNAKRVGHGIAAASSLRTRQLLSERQVVLELCPTSNTLLGIIDSIRQLPIQLFLQDNVPFVLCTDNPARCRISLSEELFKSARAFSFGIDDLREINLIALRNSFAGKLTKESISRRISEQINT